MDDAALVFVREDSAAAERLAVALERAQVSVCRSASVFETSDGYGAVVALFSPAAVRSKLVMEAAARAREEGRLVPVFVGLCPLPAAFHGIAMYDLSAWGGDANDAVVNAVAQQIRRTRQVRTTKDGLAKGMGAARPLPEEPQDLAPSPMNPARAGYAPLSALDAVGWAPPSASHFDFHSAHPVAGAPHGLSGAGPIGVGLNRMAEERPHFGAPPAPMAAPIAAPRRDERPFFTAVDHRDEPARRFAGLTAADDHSGYQAHRPAPQLAPQSAAPQPPAPDAPGATAWADAWVATELRQRGAPVATDPNRHAYRAISGAGAAYPAPLAPAAGIAQPQGNSFDPPGRRPGFAAADPWAREDRLGYERPPGAQDPFGVTAGEAAPSVKRTRGRNDAAFAAMLAIGLAAGAAGAMLIGGERLTAAAPVEVAAQTTYAAPADDIAAETAPAPAQPEPMRVRAVSLDQALGDAELAKKEPPKSNAGADRGVDRRRPTPRPR